MIVLFADSLNQLRPAPCGLHQGYRCLAGRVCRLRVLCPDGVRPGQLRPQVRSREYYQQKPVTVRTGHGAGFDTAGIPMMQSPGSTSALILLIRCNLAASKAASAAWLLFSSQAFYFQRERAEEEEDEWGRGHCGGWGEGPRRGRDQPHRELRGKQWPQHWGHYQEVRHYRMKETRKMFIIKMLFCFSTILVWEKIRKLLGRTFRSEGDSSYIETLKFSLRNFWVVCLCNQKLQPKQNKAFNSNTV